MSLNLSLCRASFGVLVLAAALSTGCTDGEASPCASTADCADGFRCIGASADEDGICTFVDVCVYDSECGEGYICNDDAQCEPVGGDGGNDGAGSICEGEADCAAGLQCLIPDGATSGVCAPSGGGGGGGGGSVCSIDGHCIGGYLCNVADGVCFDGCTESAAQCAEGYQCDGADDGASVLGVCTLIPPEPYTIAIVTSEVSDVSDEVQDTVTPGPDIDAIELIAGNSVLQATVAASQLGSAPENVASDVNRVSTRDAMIGGGPTYACDINGGNYVSLGGNDGFVAVTFGAGQEMISGDIISVYELSASTCPDDVFSEFQDAYAIYIHNGFVPSSAAEVRVAACFQTGSAPDGGVTQVSLNVDACN